MNPVNLTELSQKRLVKLAIRSAKEFIAARGLNTTTRKGSKELELLIKKITGQSLSDREQATQIGQKVGEKIVELSRQKAKHNLDKGVVRQLAAQKEIFSLFVSSTDKIPSTLQPIEETSSSKAATPVMVSKSAEEVQGAKYSDKKFEDFEEEILEESDEEFEDPDEEFAEDSDEEILEEPNEEFTEDSDEDILAENLLELQEDFQKEQPVELSNRSKAIAIDSSQFIAQKEEEKQKSQEVE